MTATTATTYQVTKQFIDGILAGLTVTEETAVKFEPGFTCRGSAWLGSGYTVISVTEVTP